MLEFTILRDEIDPETNEYIGTSQEEFSSKQDCFFVKTTKSFFAAPNHPFSSTHFILKEWLERISKNNLTPYITKIEGGTIYTNISKSEHGDYFVNLIEVAENYDKPFESKYFIKIEWVEILLKQITQQ
jgi:hypothetical protein